jgi:hypothetical protein
MFILKNKLITLLFVVYSFFLSLFFLPLAVNGDQIFYIQFYNMVSDFSFLEGYGLQINLLGSAEPGYFVFSYFFSNLYFDRVLLFSFLNSLLAYLVIRWAVINKISIFVVLLISLNFYLMVLFFSSERLKLALIFFLLYLALESKLRSAFLFASIITHVQLIPFLVSILLRDFVHKFNDFFSGKIDYLFFVILFFLIGVLYFLSDHLINKIEAYSSQGGFLGLFKILLFMTLSIYYCRKKALDVILNFFPVLLLSFFFGAERLAILGYILFMYYGVQFRGGLNFGVIVLSFYFLVKGVFLLYNVFYFGDGFFEG